MFTSFHTNSSNMITSIYGRNDCRAATVHPHFIFFFVGEGGGGEILIISNNPIAHQSSRKGSIRTVNPPMADRNVFFFSSFFFLSQQIVIIYKPAVVTSDRYMRIFQCRQTWQTDARWKPVHGCALSISEIRFRFPLTRLKLVKLIFTATTNNTIRYT